MRPFFLILAALTLLPMTALANAASNRAEILKMRQETLQRLIKQEPGAKTDIEKAEGYAVFASGGVNVVLFSAGYGSGVAHDNRTGAETYMKMATGGLGFGLGVKDYRIVFVFRTHEAYDRFLKDGLDFSGQADAAAKAGPNGGEISEAADVMPGVKAYQLTENGLALQATLQGTKYWQDADMNR